MTITDYDVNANEDDFYESSTGGGAYTPRSGTTTLLVSCSQVLDPSLTQRAQIGLGTNSLPADDNIITSTLYIYLNSYTASRGVAKTYNVFISLANEGGYLTIANGVTYTAAGWKSFELTAAMMAEIDRDGLSTIRITCDGPGAGKTRNMTVRAREYVVVDTYDAYMTIEHSSVSSCIVGPIFI